MLSGWRHSRTNAFDSSGYHEEEKIMDMVFMTQSSETTSNEIMSGKIFGKPKAYMCGQGEKRVFPPAWMKNSSDIGFVRVPAIAKQPTRS